MAPIKTPSNLPDLVKTTFAKAKTNGDLTYFPSEVAILTANSIPFQVRFAPSLASKPKGPAPDPTKPKVRIDPFAEPPEALKLCDLEPSKSHYLVLNRFAITPGHFILATTEYKPQTHLLEAGDLEATLACIRAYKDAGEELFAFFNSGQHSGASQPHRHLQLLPVDEMKADVPEGETWDVLLNTIPAGTEPAEVPADCYPFRAFSATIPEGDAATGEQLRELYLALYRLACRSIDEYAVTKGYAVVAEEAHDIGITDGAAWISYNLAMTGGKMVVAPRMKEGADLVGGGKVLLNGTVLGGTALVKNQGEWDVLTREGGRMGLEGALGKIGVPRL